MANASQLQLKHSLQREGIRLRVCSIIDIGRYFRQKGYVSPGVCLSLFLSVCMSVCTLPVLAISSKINDWILLKILTEMYVSVDKKL